jgi:DNA-binding LacI/PurR family transcriptional regulator
MATKRNRTPTSIDVARLAGVSKSAVSRAFTDGASVAADTRQRVLEAADALGYRPNPIARSLTTRRSAIVGVAMAFMDQLYAPLLTRLSERLTQEGFRLLLFKAKPEEIADDELETLVQYNVDALILVSVKLSDVFAERCRRAGIPVVLINPTMDVGAVSTLTGSNADGGRQLGEFLIAAGHRKLAYMGGFAGSYTSEARRNGYVEAMRAAGIRKPPLYDVGNYTFDGGIAAARRLLSGSVLPDAIFCANDSMACATIDVARREFGIAVGSALSVVGFDNEPIAAWPGFDLTTYSLPLEGIVDQSIDLVRRLWMNSSDIAEVLVPGEVIVRGSARRPPVS